ncbi:MAG: M48 family metallopeptidase [Gammaproteobacteria bacterium]|nr:M48 family metallopeptidase [Gammaproteobacteria bacterium]
MSFYEHQDRARARTVQLLVLFALAVVIIVACINAVMFALGLSQAAAPHTWRSWLASAYGGWTSLSVLAVMGAGSAYTSLRLAGGGKALAAMIGARRVAGRAADAREQQLRNVVEEMSLASGTPAPALYVLDGESALNAFVAGTRPTETVMVVTRGALEAFTRDELQGVVAHEFSHVFHEDMRLNMRLMGMLGGILLVSRAGRGLMRVGRDSSEKSTAQVALLGLALFVIGYLGVLLGSVIQAAISRQREFLADASAVQFTRNPDGLASALYRIGNSGGSRLHSAHADSLAHFCFGEAVRPALAGLLATHPPLAARIAAIAPNFEPGRVRADDVAPPATGHGARGSAQPAASLAAASIAASVGRFAASAAARVLHDGLPPTLLDAARGEAPTAVTYALLLAATPGAEHAKAWEVLRQREGDASVARVKALLPHFIGLEIQARLPLLNLALPNLTALSAAERTSVRNTLAAIIDADGELSFFEFAVQRIVEDHLAERAARALAVRHFSFANVRDALCKTLAALAWGGSEGRDAAEAAFLRAWRPFSLGMEPLPARQDVTARALVSALAELAALSPLLKQNVISACADCVLEDGRVHAVEAELLQAIALSLDCPLPPLASPA